MDLKIRRMEPEDAVGVSEIESQVFSEPWTCQGFLDTLAGGQAIFMVAEADQKIVGYCGMYCALDEGEITNVAVDPMYRRNGIGEKLMSAILAEGKEAGIALVILEVRVSNEPAIQLYEKFGFSIQGVRRGFYEKPKEDGYVMTLSQ